MEKYENLGLVGEGSYGMVLKCRHRETSQLVAIKKFLETENDKMVKKIALREVKMLKQLRHENLVNLIEVFRRKKRLYLVFEFVDRTALDDLEKYPTGADESYVKKVMWQVLKGIDFCHTHNVIHRDIKPENILISKRGVVKICDFGFARLIAPPGEAYTDYVATRWYRSPELLVGDTNYGRSVDVWAVGCLFSEMLTGEPLFPGESDIDQLYLITKCFGNLIAKHREVFSRNPLFIGMRLPEARELDPIERRYPRLSSASMDIIKWSLRLDPSDRPTCTQLLRHELFQRNGWADKYTSELRSKILQEVEENPLLKNLGFTSSESGNESTQRHQYASQHPPKTREPTNGRLMVGTGTGGFSSGTEAMYSGTEEVPRKKEKKKKVKKETVLNREKAYYDQHVLKPPPSPHSRTIGMGFGLPRSPHPPLGSYTPLQKPSTPLQKPSTPRMSYNSYQDIPPPIIRQASHTTQPPPVYNITRIKDLHSTSNASVASQHETRSDSHAPRMEIPQNLLSIAPTFSPSHPPPFKKSPSSNIGLPHLSDQYTSSLLSMMPPLQQQRQQQQPQQQQSSYTQIHSHIQQSDGNSSHHLLGSGSQLGRANSYMSGTLKMEQPSPPSARLRRTQENGTGQQGFHLVPYN